MVEQLLQTIRSLPAYQKLLNDINSGIAPPGIGIRRAARPPLVASLRADLEKPILFITDRADRVNKFLDELQFWASEQPHFLFAEPTTLFYEPGAWGSLTRRSRIECLSALCTYHLPSLPKLPKAPLISTSLRALMTRTLPRRDFLLSCKVLKIGQSVQPETLQRDWVDIGYQTADIVLEPGQFSRRGGILDIWSPPDPFPARLEFFGNEIETIRQFDPATQRRVRNLEQVVITPAREILPGKAAATFLPGQTEDEFYLPLVHAMPATLLDYLPRGSIIIIDNLDHCQTSASEIEEQAVSMRRDSVQEGIISETFPLPYISWSELQDTISQHIWFELGQSTSQEESDLASHFAAGVRYGGQLKNLMNDLLQSCQQNHPVVLVSRQVARLRELWAERLIGQTLNGGVTFIEGSLAEGWSLSPGNGKQYHLLTDSEIFGWEKPVSRARLHLGAEAPEAIYADLKPGDWVVHIDYGIGRFTGLVQRVTEGSEREFLCVEYDAGTQIFIPVHQADRLSRYIGPDATPPTPTRLGTQEWPSTKQRVREEVLRVARDLLELYAQRQIARGHRFSPDTAWQQELEASFPYIETPDQARAIQEVKRDMESHRPMDRLLCGDVGYGKTEVALRAAFKAVMDGKQVAVLVPTTVLAQQHYETFSERLIPFPVQVEMLSRFRSQKEQEEIIARVANGSVDIIIGTHRLLQPDVQFKDLGLVIIDEEQRFGVTHKEHFKKLRTELDVLTLTATPIPRTLYMALSGVRDISTINTPPEERLPISTHIGPYSPRLVRQAILRELERGGQVFFVHNRVQTIEAMKRHLNLLIPEARIAIAHGQMPEAELSSVMHRFSRAEVDVLLCTSIIESGLDIPNANTLIVDRGDTFGLAQLYQLRGRVGRSAQRAYAYFFRHRNKAPTPEGQERLEVIAENTQLGAGYSIAMRDLEMRGAGEMLGTRQHGYIAAVGFHLYTSLLAQAVHTLRLAQGIKEEPTSRQPREIRLPVSVELPLAVGLPIDYISDQNLRLRLYRRIANLNDEEELKILEDEFSDRFGEPPEPVRNLFYEMRLKMRAEQAGLASVSLEGNQVVLRFPPLPEGISSRGLPEIGLGVRSGKNAYWIPVEHENWKESLLEVLSAIIATCHPHQPEKI